MFILQASLKTPEKNEEKTFLNGENIIVISEKLLTFASSWKEFAQSSFISKQQRMEKPLTKNLIF